MPQQSAARTFTNNDYVAIAYVNPFITPSTNLDPYNTYGLPENHGIMPMMAEVTDVDADGVLTTDNEGTWGHGFLYDEGALDPNSNPYYQEWWALLPVTLDKSNPAMTATQSNLAGGIRANAQAVTDQFCSRTLQIRIKDHAGNDGVLASDMRTCNHFFDAYSSQSPAGETHSYPIYFTAENPAVWAGTDAWHKPDFAAAFKGRMWPDSVTGAWIPVVPLGCADVDAVLGLTASLLSYQIADQAGTTYTQNVAASLQAAIIADFIANALVTPNLSIWVPPAPPTPTYTMPCDGETGSWSDTDDVPLCS